MTELEGLRLQVAAYQVRVAADARRLLLAAPVVAAARKWLQADREQTHGPDGCHCLDDLADAVDALNAQAKYYDEP